jgi:hypothetical protein
MRQKKILFHAKLGKEKRIFHACYEMFHVLYDKEKEIKSFPCDE